MRDRLFIIVVATAWMLATLGVFGQGFLAHRRGAFTGGFGNASRDFDAASSEYIAIGSSTASFNFIHDDKVFTIAYWIKVDNQATPEIISFMGNNATSAEVGFICGYEDRTGVGNEAARIMIFHGSLGLHEELTCDNAITTTGWYHLCFTGDGSTMKCYVDGVVHGTTESVTYTGTYGNAGYDLNLGRYNFSSPGGYLDGHLSDVRIYDADIGATEAANLAAGTDYQTNLVAWWLKDSDDVLDHLGSLDGTNNGSTWDADGPLGLMTKLDGYKKLTAGATGTLAIVLAQVAEFPVETQRLLLWGWLGYIAAQAIVDVVKAWRGFYTSPQPKPAQLFHDSARLRDTPLPSPEIIK